MQCKPAHCPRVGLLGLARITCGLWLAGSSVAASAAAGRPLIEARAIRAHMRFLADDLLEGRATGSRGYDLAAHYVGTQFALAGLSPGAGGSFYQPVPLRSMHIEGPQSSFTLIRAGKPATLVYARDFLLRPDAGRAQSQVEAPVVFVGYGITAPGQHYDDYAGLDVRGKIVAVLLSAPPWESALKAHFSSSLTKSRIAAAHGAVGMLLLDDATLERIYPFPMRVRDQFTPALRWLESPTRPHNYFPALAGIAMLDMEATRELFAGTAHPVEQIYAAAHEGKPPAFELAGITARIVTRTVSHDLQGTNVVGLLPGSDPALAGEYVAFSAHLDHLGVGAPVNGDAIYNGALDNASGTAIMLELARAYAQQRPRPRRSMLFVAVTGEEEGLIGSDYFANRPGVPAGSIVANINIDEDQMLWPLRSLIVYGAEHSSLQKPVRDVAASMGLKLDPDPEPEQVTFVRSDQYSFVQRGVPSIMPVPGLASTDAGIDPKALLERWQTTRYHQVGDDMQQPGLDFDSAARFAEFIRRVGAAVAQDPRRSTWNDGDFFGTQFGAQARGGTPSPAQPPPPR